MLVTEITAKSIDEALRKQLDSLQTSVDAREATVLHASTV